MKAIGISLLLAAIPIGFIVYLAFTGDIGVPPHWTVDGLFMTLILLTISGILALNAVLEAHAQGLIRIPGMGEPAAATAGGGSMSLGGRAANLEGLKTEVGVIEQVDYFDAPVGQPNKSFVQIRGKGEKAPHTIVLEGNVRGLLIPGRRMQLAYKPQAGGAALVSFDFK
ncbi:MAG: hypothetical protein M3P27_00855 [Acidobacteriota bacterium]|nr:hypothetical protein [Acidobacteriota bacterium]